MSIIKQQAKIVCAILAWYCISSMHVCNTCSSNTCMTPTHTTSGVIPRILHYITQHPLTDIGVVIHMCRRHAAPTQAQVRLHGSAWHANLPSVNSWRLCFSCCWCKGVEQPAKRCDISFVAGGVQEQAQDVLVPPLLWNCLTKWHFLFPVISSPPEQWSLQ